MYVNMQEEQRRIDREERKKEREQELKFLELLLRLVAFMLTKPLHPQILRGICSIVSNNNAAVSILNSP